VIQVFQPDCEGRVGPVPLRNPHRRCHVGEEAIVVPIERTRLSFEVGDKQISIRVHIRGKGSPSVARMVSTRTLRRIAEPPASIVQIQLVAPRLSRVSGNRSALGQRDVQRAVAVQVGEADAPAHDLRVLEGAHRAGAMCERQTVLSSPVDEADRHLLDLCRFLGRIGRGRVLFLATAIGEKDEKQRGSPHALAVMPSRFRSRAVPLDHCIFLHRHHGVGGAEIARCLPRSASGPASLAPSFGGIESDPLPNEAAPRRCYLRGAVRRLVETSVDQKFIRSVEPTRSAFACTCSTAFMRR